MARLTTYSASFAFFEALYEAGVRYVFANLGSDHPAIMEALAKARELDDVKFPTVITCPHEYCCYAGEFKTGKNIKQLTSRALQFAISDVPGPVYMVGAREPELEIIIKTLAEAESLLILVGYSGRNTSTVLELVTLVESIPRVRVLNAMGSSLSFPFGHRVSILTKCKPREDAKILHINLDPLKSNIPLYYIPATRRYHADVGVALKQLNEYVRMSDKYSRLASQEPYISRWNKLAEEYKKLLNQAAQATAYPEDTTSSPSTSYLYSQLRRYCPKDTI
ncbi:acetolactate synthase [Fusarium phyllophilum]|uniref:Acetolactate synthase n=1 Tax=Fusarium phyllophilum TaxID=47803 RepID=A0A8H5II60_9HYPO|nr:acetolactate synthase [Fusarium phyllophilum]